MKSIAGLGLRSLRYFWRTQVGVLLGAACASTVLVGALLVGDSVRLSLRAQAENRIGQVDAALAFGERYFRDDLFSRIATDLEGASAAALLQLPGLASTEGGASRAGIVDIYGVSDDFFELSPRAFRRGISGPGEAMVNSRLAAQLDLEVGDTILVRVQKPSALPRDMVMATIDDISHAMRIKVVAIVTAEDFGSFSLRASQLPPLNLYLPLHWLQEQLDLRERANLLLLSDGGRPELVDRANRALRSHWSLGDAGMAIKSLAGGANFELSSERVFIDEVIVDAVAKLEPGLTGVLTYFVNGLRAGERSTPYSMVSAIGPLSSEAEPAPGLDFLPDDLDAAGIVINRWLADDLQAGVGDTIAVEYLVMSPNQTLEEESSSFEVKAIVPIEGPAADPGLMPAFPGMVDTEHCRDWEPGVPVELERIRDVDEDYWTEYRGTPKAFIDLGRGQDLWQNRFGNLTALRGPAAVGDSLAASLTAAVDPASFGLFFMDLRGPALAAGSPATDFGGLFLGLSFFLIIAALLLMALLHGFGVEQRAREIGTLLAVGFRPAQVRRMFLGEALLLSVIGSAIGALLGMLYTRAVLLGLGSLWQEAVGAASIEFYLSSVTVAIGTLSSVFAALVAITLALRRSFRRPAIELLAGGGIRTGASLQRGPGYWHLPASIVLALSAVGITLSTGTGAATAALTFFGAGALLLIAGLLACRHLLHRISKSDVAIGSLWALAMRNAGRRPGRSLATIALLASGTFLVVAVQVHRLGPPSDHALRSSGTGGFALFGRSTLPVLRDLGVDAGREVYGLDGGEYANMAVVPLRVRDGDDASCLNLSQPQNPRLIAVRPESFAERGAFGFSDSLAAEGLENENPWRLLDADYGEDVVPAIGDQASITWSLHKRLGDDLEYRDEQGGSFRVRLVGSVSNSILQGSLVISERRFMDRFPSTSGHRMFLIDAPGEEVAAIASGLTRALEDLGIEITTTADRLMTFNAVQNSYLLIFLALGGLGLLLGSAGLGMVVLRNVLERRSELALVSAVGYPRRAIRELVWSEHGLLLALGMLIGGSSALIAVLPGMRDSAEGLPFGSMALLILAVAVSASIWVIVATASATRGPLLGALRSE